MLTSCRTLGGACITVLLVLINLYAGPGLAQKATSVDVLINSRSVSIQIGSVANFKAMNVRIMDPSGNFVVHTQSRGEPVHWSPGAYALDGHYRYEAVILHYDPATDSRVEDGPRGESLSRSSGSFRVEGGIIVAPTGGEVEQEKKGLLHRAMTWFASLLNTTLDVLIPAAYAQDVTVSSGFPEVFFDETDIGSPGSIEWRLRVTATGCATPGRNCFLILDSQQGNATVVDLRSSPNNANSLVVDPAGDIGLANNALFITRASQHVGVGTTATGPFEFTVADTNPEIALLDETDNTTFSLEYDNGELRLEGNGEQDIVRIASAALENSLVINAAGTVTLRSLLLTNGASPLGAAPMVLGQDIGNRGMVISDKMPTNTRYGFMGWDLTLTDFEIFAVHENVSFRNLNLVPEGGNVGIGRRNPAAPLHMGSGAHVTTGGVWTNASSRAHKTNIQALTADEAAEALSKLTPVTFNYTAEGEEKYVGFIAEDVPDLVATQDRQGLSPMDIVGVLTRVVQEQQGALHAQHDVILQQQQAISALSAQMTELARRLESK